VIAADRPELIYGCLETASKALVCRGPHGWGKAAGADPGWAFPEGAAVRDLQRAGPVRAAHLHPGERVGQQVALIDQANPRYS